MSKYIDSEKLLAEIARRKKQDVTFRERSILIDMENAINSLQQEQPEVDLEEEIYDYMKKHHLQMLDGGRIVFENGDTPNFMCDFRDFAGHFFELGKNARKEELPEIELNKFANKVNTFKARYKHPESISINGAMAFMARMFYQYPNAARQWYDSLPKATMD